MEAWMDVEVSSSRHKTQPGKFPRATLIHVLRIPFISALPCGASGRKRWRDCALLFKLPRLWDSALGARDDEYFIKFWGVLDFFSSAKRNHVCLSLGLLQRSAKIVFMKINKCSQT